MVESAHPMIEQITPKVNFKKLPQYFAAAAVSLGAVAAGTVIAWSSPVLPQLEAENATLHITKEEGTWIGSLLTLGAIFGPLPAGYCADRFGRKITTLSLAIPYLISWILIVFAQNVATLYIARIFAGIATGAVCVTAPMYVSEISHSSVRGILGSFFQLFLVTGILFSFVIGSLVNYIVLSIISGSVVLVFAVSFFFMPETPTFYMSKNRKKEAQKSLRWLRGQDYDVTSDMEELQAALDATASNAKVSIIGMVKNRVILRGLIAALGCMAFQQLSGINAVMFYTEGIFKDAGSTLDPSIAAIIVALVQVLSCFVSVLVVEKLGRKIMLLQSSAIMAICLTTIGIFFKLKADKADVSSISWLPLASLVVFMIAFSLGFGPVPWLIMGEVFSNDVKGVAVSLAVITNWTMAFIVTLMFPNLLKWIQTHNTFWVFAVLMAICTAFVFFLVPETKGKTLDEIHKDLAGSKNKTNRVSSINS